MTHFDGLKVTWAARPIVCDDALPLVDTSANSALPSRAFGGGGGAGCCAVAAALNANVI